MQSDLCLRLRKNGREFKLKVEVSRTRTLSTGFRANW
jgi:hypothetical protein